MQDNSRKLRPAQCIGGGGGGGGGGGAVVISIEREKVHSINIAFSVWKI